jgi:hypothetical protein
MAIAHIRAFQLKNSKPFNPTSHHTHAALVPAHSWTNSGVTFPMVVCYAVAPLASSTPGCPPCAATLALPVHCFLLLGCGGVRGGRIGGGGAAWQQGTH